MRLDCYSVGEYGDKVRVYRLAPGGPFYSEIGGKQKIIRLPNNRRITHAKDARSWARRICLERKEGIDGGATLAAVCEGYLLHRSPVKATKQERDADQRRSKLWQRVLGPSRAVESIERGDIERFVRQRGFGEIDAWGRMAEERSSSVRKGDGDSKARACRPRTVQADINWLRGVLRYHMADRCPIRSWSLREVARELNVTAEPRQPVATQDRYEVLMRSLSEKPIGYLYELLPLVASTGHRLSEILSLQWRDIDLDAKPFGTIRWRADAVGNKARLERVVPMNAMAHAAIKRAQSQRPGIGESWLFPRTRRPKGKKGKAADEPIHRSVADKWLRQAEKAAKLPPQPGSLWHAYRRKWATEKKHLPDADVAFAGGWKNARTLRSTYQHADHAGVLRAVLDTTELREGSA